MTQLDPNVIIFLVVGLGVILVLLVLGRVTGSGKGTGSAFGRLFIRVVFPVLVLAVLVATVVFLLPQARVVARTTALRATAPPTGAGEYHAYAGKALGLFGAGQSKEDDFDRAFWEKVQTMSAEARGITANELTVLQEGGDKIRTLLKKVHEEHVAEVKKLETGASKLPEADQRQLEKALTPTLAGPAPKFKLPPGHEMLQQAMAERVDQIDVLLAGASFKDLSELKGEEIELAYQPGVQALLRKSMPKELESSRALVRRQAQEIRETTGAMLAALGTDHAGLWSGLTVEMTEELGTLSPEKLDVRQAVALKQLQTLASKTDRAKVAANTRFLPALLQSLVCLGVLGVELLYFWRWFRASGPSAPANSTTVTPFSTGNLS